MGIERKPISSIEGLSLRLVRNDEDRVPYGWFGLARVDSGEIVAIIAEDDLFDGEANHRFIND